MVHLVFSHWKKTKRTVIRPMLFLLPVLFSFLLAVYFWIRNSNEAFTGEKFVYFYLLLMIAVLFFSAIILSLFIQLDKTAGNFGNELRIGVSRRKLMISKIVFFMVLVFFVELFAIAIFVFLGVLLQMELINFFAIVFYFLVNSLLLLPTILIYTFCAYRFNYTGTLMVGILFVLSAILMGTTGLGSNLWKFLPWVWPVKVSADILPTVLLLTTGGQNLFINGLAQLIIVAVISSLLLFLLLNVWYNQWEGKGSLEE